MTVYITNTTNTTQSIPSEVPEAVKTVYNHLTLGDKLALFGIVLLLTQRVCYIGGAACCRRHDHIHVWAELALLFAFSCFFGVAFINNNAYDMTISSIFVTTSVLLLLLKCSLYRNSSSNYDYKRIPNATDENEDL